MINAPNISENNMCFARNFSHLQNENGNTLLIDLWGRRQISLLLLSKFKRLK